MSTDGFVTSANLPDGNVTLCICSDAASADALERLGTQVLCPLPSPFLSPDVSKHSDMQLCHLGGRLIIADRFQQDMIKKLGAYGFEVYPDDYAVGEYPNDIRFNGAVCGGFLFGRTDRLSPVLRQQADFLGLKSVSIPQGYAKCSVCFVSERALITDDPSFEASALRLGFDALRISKGDIFLSETHYGFIGGCSGKLSKDTVAFTGCLDSHRDGDTIKKFLKKYGCRPIELSNGILKDTGGILPIKEEQDVFIGN